MLGVTLFGALVIPLAVVFEATAGTGAVAAAWVITLAFAVDIFLNLNTAVLVQGKLVTDHKWVTRRYIRSWFALDLVAVLPIGILLPFFSVPEGSILPMLQLNILVKLLRTRKTLWRIGGANANPAIIRLCLLVFWILLAAHLISCGWMFITGNPQNVDGGSRYVRAFYWTITTLTTIGYGDIVPKGRGQTLFVIVIELLGAGMYGLIIGNIASLVANIDVAKTQYRERLDKINTFLRYRGIPQDLQRRINGYYDYLWETRRGYDESSVLADLPVPLKVSVSLFLNKEIIENVPIFKGASADLVTELILNLKPVVYTPGDYIMKAGEVGFDMFFISKGAVDVLSADEKTIYATLNAGQFFGEIALLLSTPRTATIKAKEFSDLYRLEKDAFDRVIARYPEFAKSINELVEQRRAEIATREE